MSNIIPKQGGYFREYSLVHKEIREKAHRLFYQTNCKRLYPNLILEKNQQVLQCAVSLEKAKN